MEENKYREKTAEEKAIKIAEACSDEIHQIVRYLMKKFKYINEHPSLSPIAKYLEIQEAIRSPNSGLSRNEANMILTKLFIGINDHRIHNALKANSDDISLSSLPSISPTNSLHNSNGPTTTSGSHGLHPLNVSMEYQPVRNSMHTPKFRNSIKSIKFQFSSQEIYQAIFEAKKITIMRSLLQEIDIDSTQQSILTKLQEELLQRQQKNEISPDVTTLPVNVCYTILENLHELRLNRAQIMFLISLADCYDREGKNLEIYRFAEHASSIIQQLNDSDVLETRAEVMNLTVIDDRKTFQGLREREFIDELTQHIQHFIEKRKQMIKELLHSHHTYEFNRSSSAKGVQQLTIKESRDEDNSVHDEDDEYSDAVSTHRIDRMMEGNRRRSEWGLRGGDNDDENDHKSTNKDEKSPEQIAEEENEKKLQFLLRLDDNTIGKEELYDILRTLPRNKYSDREITTIIAGIRIPVGLKSSLSASGSVSSGVDEDEEFNSIRASLTSIEVAGVDIVNWRDLLQPLVEAIRSLQREHIIHRRVSLIATSMSMPPSNGASSPGSLGDGAASVKDNSETTSIAKQKLQEESLKTLKSLAERLLNFVKIITTGDGGIALQLPIDSNHPSGLRRTSSQILSKDELLMNADDLHHTQITTLYRCAAWINYVTIKTTLVNPVAEKGGRKYTTTSGTTTPSHLVSAPSSANLLATSGISSMSSNNLAQLTRSSSMMPSSSSGARQNSPNRGSVLFGSGTNLLDLVAPIGSPGPQKTTEVIKEKKIAMFIQILTIEDTRYYSGSSLIANFVSADSSFSACESLSVKLPTIGLVDQEAAQQFAANLIERMYFEIDEKEKKPTLKLKDI